MSRITLKEWARRNFDPPPCPETIRRWARADLLFPAPIKMGRGYWISADARYIPPDDPVLGEIIHGTKSKKPREPAPAR